MIKDGKDSAQAFSMTQTKSRSWGAFVILGLIVAVLLIWSGFAIHSETSRRKIASLYADAFVLYDKIDLSKPYTPDKLPLIQEALTAMEKVLAYPEKFPEWYLACSQIGFLYVYQKDSTKAISYLEKIQQAPRSFLVKTQSLVVLARLYLREKNLRKAISVYRSLETQTDGEVLNFVRYQMGILYASKKDSLSQALSMYQKISPDSSLRPLANRNMVLLRANQTLQ